MNINYTLTNHDFLEYYLYASSRSKSHKKRRFRSRIIIPIIYLLFGFYSAKVDNNIGIGIVFALVAIVWFIFYPMYSRWRYKKHYQKHVKENYRNRINKPIEIDFDGDEINTKDFSSESRINGTEIKELVETKNHFFIILNSDMSLVVPKHSIMNQSEFKTRILDFGAEYIDELDWKW